MLYAQQCAWLAAVPEGTKKTRATQLRAVDPEHPDLELPEAHAAQYLIAYWQELGLCGASGFGPTPLTFLEIEAWQRSTALTLSPWEVLTIRRLSSEYVAMLSKATDPNMISPWRGQDLAERRAIVDQTFRELAQAHARYDRHRKSER